MNTEQIVRTRIAPTPSGFLHLGNVLSFAITAALAKARNAVILLRIDDLDRERVQRPYVQDIFDTLRFLEIPWDEGPRNYGEYKSAYSQLHRMDLYNKALQQLRASGQLFACNCSRAQVAAAGTDGVYPGTCRNKGLSLDQPGVSWRLRTDAQKELAVNTLSGKVINAVLPATMCDFVVRKKDGFPAYQLTSVLDDQHFGVNLIVRGEDLWPSTLAQLYLAELLGQQAFLHSTFHHHVLLLAGADKKLSKSAGDTSVQYLRHEGKQPADLYSMIARMLGQEQPVKDYRELAALAGLPAGNI